MIADARHRSALCLISSVWRDAATALDVRLGQAARFVGQCIEQRSLIVYQDDDTTGLSFPASDGGAEAIRRILADCDKDGWDDAAVRRVTLRLTLEDAATVLAVAEALRAGPREAHRPIRRGNPELDELARRYIVQIQEFARTQPSKFAELICEGVLCDGVSEKNSVALSPTDEHLVSVARTYRYLARLILSAMRAEAPALPDSGFVSIRQWVESECMLVRDYLRWWDYDSEHVQDVWTEFFREPVDSLSQAVAMSTHLISQGVPVYESLDGRFTLLPDDCPLACYLRGRGEEFDVVERRQVPPWGDSLYFDVQHLRWHRVFFANEDVASPQDIRRQAVAFRKHLGLPSLDAIRVAREAEVAEPMLATRERETMLRIIFAAAVGGYGYDPGAARSDAARNIADDAVRAGVRVSDDTVRKYLKEAASRVGPSGPR
jgi:hypothetical protein